MNLNTLSYTSQVEVIAKAVHNSVSGFKVAVGQKPYDPWEQMSLAHKELCRKAVELVNNNPYTTAEDIHNYWMDWAKQNIPNHPMIVPFSDLPVIEKIKDELVITTILAVLQHHTLN